MTGRSTVPRWRAPAALLLLLLLLWAVGPLVLVATTLALAVPATRRRVLHHLRPPRPGARSTGVVVASAVVLLAGAVVVPDGILPIPPGAGALVTPEYLGRPAFAQPIVLPVPQNPFLASEGTGRIHQDSWATDAYDLAGPLGESPEVDTGWSGLADCAQLTFEDQGRLLGSCATPTGRDLRVIDPDSLRPRASLELSGSCDPVLYLDAQGSVVVSGSRGILVVRTSDGRDEPDLSVDATYDLDQPMGAGDCLVGLLPDWAGRIWWASSGGAVGFVDPTSGRVRSLQLEEPITQSLSVDRGGGVYVVTDRALHRLGVDGAGRPQVEWRSVYDRGTDLKSGQSTQGSGTTPTLLPGGLVAITDNASPRMHVQFYAVGDGRLVCQQSVFADGEGATDGSLIAVGSSAVVVQNTAGDEGVEDTILGRAPVGGFARVEVLDGRCRTAWTNDEVAARSVSSASLVTGLIYAMTKRRNYWGVNAWYLTAIDARTGQRIWSRRTGIGSAFDPHGSVVTLGPAGSAYLATATGLVRVRDRRFSRAGS